MRGAPVHRPVETFGTIYLQADGWHTNSEGYGMLVEEILEVLRSRDDVRAHAARAAIVTR